MKDKELLEIYRTGNQKEKDFAVEEILKNIEPYIKSVLSRKYSFLMSNQYYDEVMLECKITIWEQIQKYDPSEEASFLTYCRLPINCKIRTYLEKNVFNNSFYKHKQYGKVTFTNYEAAEPVLSEKRRFEDDLIDKLDILNLLDTLDYINKFILVQFYINQISIKDISRELGISEKSVKKRKEYSIKKLRKLV